MKNVIFTAGTLLPARMFLLAFLFLNSCGSEAEIEGCTNSNSLNYDRGATVDDGSCINPEILGLFEGTFNCLVTEGPMRLPIIVQITKLPGLSGVDSIEINFFNDFITPFTTDLDIFKGYVKDNRILATETRNFSTHREQFRWESNVPVDSLIAEFSFSGSPNTDDDPKINGFTSFRLSVCEFKAAKQ